MSGRDPPDETDQLELFVDETDDGSFEWFMHNAPSLAENPQLRGDHPSSISNQPQQPRARRKRAHRQPETPSSN